MFIEQNLGAYRLDILCRVLEVTPGGFHTWRRRPLAHRHLEDRELKEQIQCVYDEHRGRYGAPRIQAELTATGRRHGTKRVARLMGELGLYGKTRRKRVKTTVSGGAQPVAENVLDRNFTPEAPNTVWASDITYIPTREGWLYLSVTMDLYARSIVGWAMDSTMPAELPVRALDMAVKQRGSAVAGVLHHSDRGSQYTSGLFQAALEAHGMQCSMSRVGECWDNAVVESFFETLKRELIEGVVYHTLAEAQRAIFEYVEVYYNRKRRHSTLGYLTPWEAERQAEAA